MAAKDTPLTFMQYQGRTWIDVADLILFLTRSEQERDKETEALSSNLIIEVLEGGRRDMLRKAL